MTTNTFPEMDGRKEYEYGHPTLARTWIPAYPGLSRQFNEDYDGQRVARSMTPPHHSNASGSDDGDAVQSGVEAAQVRQEQKMLARELRPYDTATTRVDSSSGTTTGQAARRERPSNFPRLQDEENTSLASHSSPSTTSRLPRSQGSIALRGLVVQRPSIVANAQEEVPQVSNPGTGRSGGMKEAGMLAKLPHSQKAISDDGGEASSVPGTRGGPGTKRKTRDDSESAEPTPKRAKASNVIANVFNSMPAYARQTPISPLSGNAAPPGVPPEELLQVGKGRAETATDGYGELLRGHIPVNTQMPLNTVITVQELAAFHPHSFQFPQVAKRMIRNKVASAEVARMQLEAAGELSDENHLTLDNRLKYQYSKGGQLACHDKFEDGTKFNKKLIEADGAQTDLTADQWRFRSECKSRKNQEAFGHVKLADIYEPVSAADRPTGKGRGKLTRYLEFAEQYDAAHPDAKLDTSHWNWIATQVNAQNPQLSAGFATLDHEVMAGLRAAWQT